MVSVDLPPGLPDTAGETRHRFAVMRPTGGDEPRVGNDGLPPGPRWPAILQTVSLLRFRHRFHPWLARRYGDRFTVRLVPGGQPLVLFTRPEDVREVLSGRCNRSTSSISSSRLSRSRSLRLIPGGNQRNPTRARGWVITEQRDYNASTSLTEHI